MDRIPFAKLIETLTLDDIRRDTNRHLLRFEGGKALFRDQKLMQVTPVVAQGRLYGMEPVHPVSMGSFTPCC
ncbi:hypothetical protein AA21291_0708 [Swaminathania salitolerans LMG 21291]|uniref:Uncharacterized protein n=1 Tax=Swaminathania salitolerans TaxID=182838 RepID=A0A511BRW7_9PROT|nr:hypothetical protein AA21291_0708 [Swaminathania salitolerans LMG 21291]GEL02364.1 hypothetical protein SSA02_15270 [Swaminathania salitolerans]